MHSSHSMEIGEMVQLRLMVIKVVQTNWPCEVVFNFDNSFSNTNNCVDLPSLTAIQSQGNCNSNHYHIGYVVLESSIWHCYDYFKIFLTFTKTIFIMDVNMLSNRQLIYKQQVLFFDKIRLIVDAQGLSSYIKKQSRFL